MAIRIVLAEDEYLVREGLRRLLDTQEDLEVVSVCDPDGYRICVGGEAPPGANVKLHEESGNAR